MKVKVVDRSKRSRFDEVPSDIKNKSDNLIEELFENEKSVGFKAKNGGFPFKGKGARVKAIEQARKMIREKGKKHG